MRIKIKKQKKKQLKKSWAAQPRYWMALGTLATYSAVADRNVALAQASPTKPPQLLAQNGAGLPVRRFDIPAGPLDAVLQTFEQATGITIQMSQEELRRVSSPGVAGLYPVEQALELLLKDTGIDYRFSDSKTVTLTLKSVATSVEVTSCVSALATVTPKYSAPLEDTPQTIAVVSVQVMQQQGTTTLRDALRNVAGISLAAGEAGAQGDSLTVRGFSARNDLFIDGMRDFGSYYRDPFNTEEVEVLEGPSSVTFGRGSTGGVVNQSTKTPQLSQYLHGDLDFGTDLTRRGVLDWNSPVAFLGSGAAFRLNVMGDENDVAGRDVTRNRRFGVAPSLSLGLGTPTRLTLSYFHQSADDIPDYGIPWLLNGPAPVPERNYYGFADGNFLRTNDDIGTAKVEHDFGGKVTLRDQVRYAHYKRDVQITEPQVLSPSLTTPLTDLLINRNQIAVNSTETYLDNQLDLTAQFKTGWIRHNFVAGAEGGRETSEPTRPKFRNVPTTSLLDPDPEQAFTGTPYISSRVNTTSVSASVYALDSVQLGRKWIVSGGIRFDRFDTDYKQFIAPVLALSRVDEMPTWRGAVVYKPVAHGSIYVDAGTSFNPSAESLSLSASTADLSPERNRTYEAGTKWDFLNGRLSVAGAIFRTIKLNAREPDPNNPLLSVLAGTQRVNGAQFEVRGRVTSRWDLLTSYASLDGKVVSSNYYPAAIGAQLANVPRNTFNVWNEFRLPYRLHMGAGSNFVDSRTASSTVPFDPITKLVKQVPSYWVVNLMASRELTEHISLQANIYNLADRYYYDELHPGHIVLGPGRSALFGVKYRF